RDIDNAQLDQPLSFRQITDVEFTPDGRRLVATSITGVWAAWDTESWQLIHGPVTDDPVFDFAFSPDGSVVATLARDGTLTLRDTSDYSPLLPPIQAHDATRFGGEAIRLSADGDLLFSNGAEGVHMWDAATLEPIGIVFPHDKGYAGELAPDAEVLMTYIDDRIVLWNVDVDAWPTIACQAVGRNMTLAEWEEYAPAGQEYQVTCPQWSANA
ncbi:MAG: WD40 repeat domain-containing protein, partial [Actinomycetia bacterium]|nr:WD40 repeat domain-containing protein [Actinomycetes bacterium]